MISAITSFIPSRKCYWIIVANLLFLIYLPLLTGQQIAQSLHIIEGNSTTCDDYLISDGSGSFLVAINHSTRNPGIWVGNNFVTAFRQDTVNNLSLSLSDFYLLKIDTSYNLEASFIIDNAENIRDVCGNNQFTLIGLTLYPEFDTGDSLFPITLNGQIEVNRSGNRGSGALVVLDSKLNYISHQHFTTGEIGLLALDGHFAYMEILIPAGQDKIIVASDTIYNNLWGGVTPLFQSVVLCKYDLTNNSIVWTKRIGGSGEEKLTGMEVSNAGDLVICGLTSSASFHFSPGDSTMNNEEEKAFLAKYDVDGNLTWGIINQNRCGDRFGNLKLDRLDNIYCAGYYYAETYRNGDTTLYNSAYDGFYSFRGLTVKFSANGDFIWASQLEGEFDYSNMTGLDIRSDNSVILSGWFRDGTLLLGNDSLNDNDNNSNTFLIFLSSSSGQDLGHLYTSGTTSRRIQDVVVDKSDRINIFLRFFGHETIFGSEFTTGTRADGFVLKLNSDFPSATTDALPNGITTCLYPNPITRGDELFLDLSTDLSATEVEVIIYDALGILLQSSKHFIASRTLSIPTRDLPKGAYWVAVSTQAGSSAHLLNVE